MTSDLLRERRAILHLLFQREQRFKSHEYEEDTDGHYRHVIYKLLGFTLAMIVGPIGSYFLTVNTIFGGGFSTISPRTFHNSA